MASPISLLLIQTQHTLRFSQAQLGELVGVAKRTIQRWQHGGTTLSPSNIQTLAAAVHPIDPDLAARIAAHGNTSLQALGIVKPAPPPPPPIPAAPAPAHSLPTSILIDSIVCVAADAIGVQPRAIRPALAAAFVRAREVRLDVAAVADSLTGVSAPAKEGAARRPAPGRRPRR
jgi:transcriptional regulator with XRE-family HTH domain